MVNKKSSDDPIQTLTALVKISESMTPLVEQLPKFLPTAIWGMVTGGKGAVGVSKAIKREGGLPINAQRMVDDLVMHLANSKEFIEHLSAELTNMADTLNDAGKPRLKKRYLHLDLGLFGQYQIDREELVRSPISVQETRGLLQRTASELGTLGLTVSKASDDLKKVSQDLEDTGESLQELGDGLQQAGAAIRKLNEKS